MGIQGPCNMFYWGHLYQRRQGYSVGVFIAMIIISSIANGLTLLNVPINFRDFFEGAILILAILVDSVRVRRRELLLA